jgi:hypothetical protein
MQLDTGVLDAYVLVTVDPSGKLLKAVIWKSSGHAAWDNDGDVLLSRGRTPDECADSAADPAAEADLE